MAARGVMWAITCCSSTLALAGELPPPAYQLIASKAGIPSTVLFSIALQESGTALRGRTVPWPWTLNVAGTPQRFADRRQACAALQHALRQHHPKRIDVGLGQTNLGYHTDRYATPCDALDPRTNLEVTADLLREHYAVTSDWIAAAGRYHLPAGGAPAARYRALFSERWHRIQASATPPARAMP